MTLYEGTSQIQKLLIGRAETGVTRSSESLAGALGQRPDGRGSRWPH